MQGQVLSSIAVGVDKSHGLKAAYFDLDLSIGSTQAG